MEAVVAVVHCSGTFCTSAVVYDAQKLTTHNMTHDCFSFWLSERSEAKIY